MALPPRVRPTVGGPTPTVAERQRQKQREASERSKIKSWSLKQLIKAMTAYRKNSEIRETGKAEILDVKLSKTKIPYLIVNAQVRGTSLWQQTLHFPATFTSSVMDDLHPLAVHLGSGEVVYIRQVSADDPVLVRCNCPDYRHSFSWENYSVKSLQGKRIPYQKVPGSNRGPRNPEHIPGICKHLRSVVHELQKPTGGWKIIKPFAESFSTSVAGYVWRN